MATSPLLTPERQKAIADQLFQVNYGYSIFNPRAAARITYDGGLEYVERRFIPTTPKPRGIEVEPGIFVEELATFDGHGLRSRYCADFSHWEGDQADIYIPNAGECAKRAGIDTTLYLDVDHGVHASSHTDAKSQVVESLVRTGKRQLTDKLLEVMGTTRSEVMEEHYERMRNAGTCEWPGYGAYDNPLQPGAIIPRGVHEGFWEHYAHQANKDIDRLTREALEARRLEEERARVRREQAELEELAKEAAELDALESSELYAAWG